MSSKKINCILLFSVFFWLLASCSQTSISMEDQKSSPTANVQDSPLSTATEIPQRFLSICMGQEPSSLFLYADESLAARTIRQAIYDGPYDILNYDISPVILEQIPNLTNGGIRIEPVSVQNGNIIADVNRNLVVLEEGVTYYPPGCADMSCAVTYTVQEPVNIDQVVVQFKLKDGILWSDGIPLTADDSQFSFEIANELFPKARADVISATHSYQALDETTIEWRGLPGYQDAGVQTYFFTPLPRHAWEGISSAELAFSEQANLPLGWGAYQIDEWLQGDHITLSRNLNYFRADQNLPAFDKLVFRFVANQEEALAALLAGECDYLDQTNHLESQAAQLTELQNSGRAIVSFATGTAWEHLDFGITPFDISSRSSLFTQKETRQAIAMCINRQEIAASLSLEESNLLNSYLSPDHPFYNPDVSSYAYDPGEGSALLESIGWLDNDGDPVTPRISAGIEGISDGAPFTFEFLTTDETEKQLVASVIQENLIACGIRMDIKTIAWDELFAPGATGPVFGRDFDMTQFGWAAGLQPPCFLYTSAEIPGPYPQFPKGWGGANATGYQNQEFDQICYQALRALPGSDENRNLHGQAQAIFSEDLPALPLYQRNTVVVARPNMCAVNLDQTADSALWNIEALDYGDHCANP